MGWRLKADRTCLITGASRGLGEFLARRFWDEGYNLCLVARSEAHLEKIEHSLPLKKGQQIIHLVCDLGDPVLIDELIIKVRATVPRLDVLVNNAAIQGPIGPLWENDFSLWQKVIQIDLLAPVALCRAFIPWMKQTGGGSIINISGGGAAGPRANFSAYATAKAGLVRFSETIAEETRSAGIRVNCIAPGAMKTAMLGEVLKKGAESIGEREFALANKVFMEGGASMSRVGDLAIFLSGQASQGITGKLISAVWDDWEHWPSHLDELSSSDAYTLRRITGRDRRLSWGDK
ncbi:MAG: SDR family oxidoreductase [Candidatus Omnitrophica bacterium]|nr:SDR family oxidoreductase [Candidatus Omnitrophota bacterium]